MPGPGWSWLHRLRSPLRTATVMMVAVARRSPAGLRRPAIRWAAVSPVQAPPRWGRDPLRTAAVLTARLTGGALSAAARIGRVGELAGSLVPVSPAPYPSAALLYARPAGPESVTVGSAKWVDWLNAKSPLTRLRVPSGKRDCGLGRVGRLANHQATVTTAPSPRPRLQSGFRLVRAGAGLVSANSFPARRAPPGPSVGGLGY